MSGIGPIPEPVEELGVRAYVEPVGWEPTRTEVRERRTSRQALVIRATAGPAGDLGFGAWAITDRDARSRPVRSGLVVPDDAPDDELEQLRSLGHDVRRRDSFVRTVLLPLAWRRQIPLVGFDLPQTLGLLAVDWTPTRDGDGLSLVLESAPATELTPKQRRGRRRLRDGGYELPWFPRVVIRALDGERAFMSYTATIDRHKGGPGHFVDVRVAYGAQGGSARSVAELAESFGLSAPSGDGPDRLLAEVAVMARAYWQILDRHESIAGRSHGLDRVQSTASYAKVVFERLGLDPPAVKWPDFPKRVLGATAESFFGGEYHLEHRGEPIEQVVPFDVQSEYGLAAALIGAWDVLVAGKLRVEPVDPGWLTERLRSITLNDALDSALYRELGFVWGRTIARGRVLPSRPATDGEWPLRVAPTWCPEPAYHHALTLVRAVLDPQSAPLEDDQIVEAFRIVPGRRRGLRPVDLPGLGTFDPKRRGADLFRFLGRGRALVAAGRPEARLESWSAPELSRFLKGFIAMASYGVFAEVRSRRARSRPELVAVWTGYEEPRTAYMRAVEEPGPRQFWPVASAVTAAGRLMFHVVGQLVAEEGGRRVYGDTDSCIAVGLTPEAILRVQSRFERLNPYGIGGPRVEIGPDGGLRLYPDRNDGALLLRIQPEAWADEPVTDEVGDRYLPAVPLTFLGWHSKRYVLLDPDGRARMFSEAGLGALLDPRDPDESSFTWIGEALEHVAGTAAEPIWADRWELAAVPANAPEVSRLYAGGDQRRLTLRPWEPLVLANEDVLVGRGRVLAAPWRPGFDPGRAVWHVFGSGERVKARASSQRDLEFDPPDPGYVEVRTMLRGLQRYALVAERGTLGPGGEPCRRATVGVLTPRPVAVPRLRRIGKEAHALEEALTGQREAITAYPADRRGSQTPAVQAFRDAIKILRRERQAGRLIVVRGARRRKLPEEIVADALEHRRAPSKVRKAIVAAAAEIAGRETNRQASSDAIALSVGRCGACGIPLTEGRTRWCSASCKAKGFRQRKAERRVVAR